jgi:hypothetical protein
MTANLTGAEGGCWIVTTRGSTHRFNLDEMTVTRIPGEGTGQTVNDRTRPLVEIVRCAVGERGYWLMSPAPHESAVLVHYWHLSSTIQSIDPCPRA